MTPKEALDILVENLDQAKLKEMSSRDGYWMKIQEVIKAINVLENMILSNEVIKNE